MAEGRRIELLCPEGHGFQDRRDPVRFNLPGWQSGTRTHNTTLTELRVTITLPTNGGRRGIRTLEGFHLTSLAERSVKPLLHPTS